MNKKIVFISASMSILVIFITILLFQQNRTSGFVRIDARCTDTDFLQAESDIVLMGTVENVQTKLIEETVEELQRKDDSCIREHFGDPTGKSFSKEELEEAGCIKLVRKMIDYTFVTILVDEYLKGEGTDKIELKYNKNRLPSPPKFVKGENIKLYLQETTSGYEIMCGDLGKQTTEL